MFSKRDLTVVFRQPNAYLNIEAVEATPAGERAKDNEHEGARSRAGVGSSQPR